MAAQTSKNDVVVIGAGLAGSAAAIGFARGGMSVSLVDPYAEFPPLFRAEKLEPDQTALLRSLGLFDGVSQRTRLIREIIRAQGGRVRFRLQREQFGISYQDIVRQVRAQIPAEVEFRIGRVASLVADSERPRVVLEDGTCVEARLIVLSTGMSGKLHEQIGVSRRVVQDELSMAFGFMLTRSGGEAFPFDAVTYRPTSSTERVGYLTLFRIGQFMRGNLFAYWPAKDPKTRELVREPKPTLSRLLPGLEQVIGDFAISARVEPFRIDLYRVDDCVRPGVVMIGDAYQSVCPSTGMGLSKVLTDVDILCNEFAPQWLASPGIGAEKIAAFYASPRKRQVDDRALSEALKGRRIVIDDSFPTRLRRRIRDWRWSTGR